MAALSASGDGSLETRPLFRELASDDRLASRPSDSRLWEPENARRSDVHRLHLRSLEAVLRPTADAADIINAVAFAMSSQGLRLVERDTLRIVAQRIEAAYLNNQPREEWRVVEATLGVSKEGASWVVLLEFKTDPCRRQSRGGVAIASLAERLSGTSGSSASLSPSAIAQQRSNRRAEALVEAATAELGRLDCTTAPPCDVRDGDAAGETGVQELVLAPFESVSVEPEVQEDRSGLVSASGNVIVTTAEEVRLCSHFVEGICARAEEYSKHDAQETWRPLEDTIHRLEGENEKLRSLLEPKYRAMGAEPPSKPTWSGLQGSGDASGIGRKPHVANGDGAAAGTSGGSSGCRRVTVLLKTTPLFVMEGTWVKARVVAARSSSGGKDEWTTAVTPADVPAAAEPQDPSPSPSSTEPRVPNEGDPESSSALDGPSTLAAAAPGEGGQLASDGAAGPARDCLLVQAAVKSLAEVIAGVCEAREEEFLKARLPGAQAYVAELERYQSVIVGGKPLRARAGSSEGGGLRGSQASVDIDDEIFRLFGAVETRLYSSSAALGKKPGRVFLTFSTLWFHSKVLGFESRHVVPLADVQSVSLLGTALDLSSSLVIATKGGGEVMLVFPGQRMAALGPLELLVRQLAVLAGKEADVVAL